MDIFNTKNKTATIMLCSSCNASCKHCYISYNGNKKFEEAKQMILQLQKQGYKVLLNGSEPLLFPKYLDLFKLTGQKQIFSNGKIILDNPNIVDDIVEAGIKQISFSYHYDVQEKWSDIDLEKVEKAIMICHKAGLKVCLLCSLCSENYDKVLEICEKAIELEVSEIHFTNFIVQGKAKSNLFNHFLLNEEQILNVLKDINKAREKYNKNQLLISRCGSFGNVINSKNFVCDAGIEDFIITPDNNVYPCLFFAGIEEYKIGEYVDGHILINKKCKFDCNDCFAKNILNYNKNINIFE